MQLTLAFLELPPPEQRPSDQIDAEVRVEAIRILARIIAQALATTRRTEAADE